MDDAPASPPFRFHDPRMIGFRSRASVESVQALIDMRVKALASERVPLFEASGRVLALGVKATSAVPPFDRSAMDGYAVKGKDTAPARADGPVVLRVIGRSRPGSGFDGEVNAGEAVEIATGAPMPAGADSVARVEAARRRGECVEVFEPITPGRHVGRVGEDVEPGDALLPSGRVLRPQDLGILSAQGLGRPEVVKRPRVAILITGEELLPAGESARGWRIPDMNAPMIASLVHRDGGIPSVIGPVADDRPALKAVLLELAVANDAILVSGGSSTGPEDHAPTLVSELGDLMAHGVALRPASPVGFGFLLDVPVVLLPGNPVSCLCAYDFFAGRVVRRLGGRNPDWPYRARETRLAQPLRSASGRVDYVRVRLVQGQVEPIAGSGASILTSTTEADGFVVVPVDCDGIAEGEPVVAWLYD